MFAHLGSEDHIDDDGPKDPVFVSCQIFEYVGIIRLTRELKGQRSMMVFQDSSEHTQRKILLATEFMAWRLALEVSLNLLIIVENGQIVVGVT